MGSEARDGRGCRPQRSHGGAGAQGADNVKPGEYGLWGEAPGYARETGRLFAPSQALTVAEDQTIRDFSIRLQPLGAISGRVVDENGEPVPGATVDGLRYSWAKGRRL